MRLPLLLAPALLCVLLPLRAGADAYDPPANYYASATGTGATLKAQLNSIIDGHTSIDYGDLPPVLGVTDDDPDPTKPNNLLTVYDRTSINKQYSNDPLIWNREHTWPRSRGVGSSGPDDSDLFNIRPALTEGNGDRQNFNFGGTYNSQGAGLVTAPTPDEWYPGNSDAGMIARQEFYMAVRYDGVDSGTTDLELVSGNPASGDSTLGDLDRLIEWHFAAPPDAFERRRNQVIFDSYQHNRDPFVDHPEWVWSVFVDQSNDSALTLVGGALGAPGASTLNVDLGRRLVGAPAPGTQNIVLNKAGLDGTYFEVTAAGAATSSVSGRLNAFRTGVPGTKSITVGLSASTGAVGLKSGTVTVDNLDVTTMGGDGAGANDGNDVVNVSMSVLDHANASFAGGTDLDSLTLDFGIVSQGSPSPTLPFSLFNLPATESFTAGLDLDGIVGSDATDVLTTDLAPFAGIATLPEGLSRSYLAMMDTATVGAYSATYALSFSDENLPGAYGRRRVDVGAEWHCGSACDAQRRFRRQWPRRRRRPARLAARIRSDRRRSPRWRRGRQSRRGRRRRRRLVAAIRPAGAELCCRARAAFRRDGCCRDLPQQVFAGQLAATRTSNLTTRGTRFAPHSSQRAALRRPEDPIWRAESCFLRPGSASPAIHARKSISKFSGRLMPALVGWQAPGP